METPKSRRCTSKSAATRPRLPRSARVEPGRAHAQDARRRRGRPKCRAHDLELGLFGLAPAQPTSTFTPEVEHRRTTSTSASPTRDRRGGRPHVDDHVQVDADRAGRRRQRRRRRQVEPSPTPGSCTGRTSTASSRPATAAGRSPATTPTTPAPTVTAPLNESQFLFRVRDRAATTRTPASGRTRRLRRRTSPAAALSDQFDPSYPYIPWGQTGRTSPRLWRRRQRSRR